MTVFYPCHYNYSELMSSDVNDIKFSLRCLALWGFAIILVCVPCWNVYFLSHPSLFCIIFHFSCHSPTSRNTSIQQREDLSLHFFPQDTWSVAFSETNVR